jgi:hypothetical protein
VTTQYPSVAELQEMAAKFIEHADREAPKRYADEIAYVLGAVHAVVDRSRKILALRAENGRGHTKVCRNLETGLAQALADLRTSIDDPTSYPGA